MQESLVSRLTGIVTFKAPVYKEVAEDTTATQTALIIVVVVAVLVGVVSGLIAGGSTLVGTLIITVVSQLIGWLLGSWLLAFVAKTLFQGQTNTGEMLRVTGHTAIFQILGVIPVIGIIGGILQIIANIIGVREAASFDTTKAILTAIIAGIIVLIVSAIIGGIFAAILIVPTMMSQ